MGEMVRVIAVLLAAGSAWGQEALRQSRKVYSTATNAFLARMGQGRNAIWLAAQG